MSTRLAPNLPQLPFSCHSNFTRQFASVEKELLSHLARVSIDRQSSHRPQRGIMVVSPRGSTRDSINDLDEETLHYLCQQVSYLMGGTTQDPFASVDAKPSRIRTPSSSSHETAMLTDPGDESRASVAGRASISTEGMESINSEQAQESATKGMIEVSPGVSVPLLGSQETWQAFANGEVTVACCQVCQEFLTCVDTCSLVLCTDCWVITPVCVEDSSPSQISGPVGLGVKANEINSWLENQPTTST